MQLPQSVHFPRSRRASGPAASWAIPEAVGFRPQVPVCSQVTADTALSTLSPSLVKLMVQGKTDTGPGKKHVRGVPGCVRAVEGNEAEEECWEDAVL